MVAQGRLPSGTRGDDGGGVTVEDVRVLGRRRALPGGRAVAGALLVTLALVGTFSAWARASTGPTTLYVVAARDVSAGATITRADLELVALDLGSSGRRAFTDVTPLVGSIATAPLAQGEVVQASHVVHGRAGGGVEISIPVAAARAVGGRLLPGDRVDVAATYGTGADAFTHYVVRGATVIEIDRPSRGLGADGTEVVTIEVPDPADALAVSHAFTAGEISLVRTTGRPAADGPKSTYRAPAGER